MCGGGKTSSSTSNQTANVSAPGNVTAWGSQLYGQAYDVAHQPFQTYGGEFVAPVNAQQQQGISGINQTAGTYAPYAGAAAGTLGESLSGGLAGTAANARLNPNQINQWMSPYIQDVVNATERQQQQQNQIQQSQLEGSAIKSGAFGGDRSGIAAANLAYQQNLANQPVIANLYNQGYGQALSAAQQQQAAGLSAANQYANIGLQSAQGLSGLGTQQQANQLGVANAQLGAGTLQQQTQQAQDTALYNQFLQQQAYPFQTTQFLSNILGQVAPLFGTTTTSYGSATQPSSFFRRGGRVGPMVDLEMGDDGIYRVAKAGGGGLSDDALAQIIAAHGQMYAPRVPAAGEGPFGTGLSSSHPTQLPVAQLPSMGMGQRSNETGASHSLNKAADLGENIAKFYKTGKEAVVGTPASTVNGKTTPATGGLLGRGGEWNPSEGWLGQMTASSPNGGISTATLPAPANGATLDPNGIPTPTLPDGTLITDNIYARGGRAGFAYGGIPYAGGISDSYIPADLAEPTDISRPFEALQQQRGMSGGSGGGGGGQQSSGLGSALGSVAKIASMVVPFLADGGRIHRDSGGATGDSTPLVTSDDLFPKMIVAESKGQQFDPKTGVPTTSPKGAVGIAQVMPGTGPEAAQLAGVPWNPELFNRGRTGDPVKDKEAEDYNRALGQAYYREQQRVFGDPTVAAAAYNAGPQAVRDAQTRAQKEGGSYLNYLPKETQDYVASLTGSRGGPPSSVGAFVPSALSGGTLAGGAPPSDKQSWWDRESGGLSGTERGIISLLSGLGGMASSPSRFLGSAILQGLGAGANTYGQLAQKGRALDIQQQQANTAVGRLGIEGVRQSTELYNKLLTMAQAAIRQGQQPAPWITDQLRQLNNTLYGYMPGQVGAGLSTVGTAAPAPTSPISLPTQTAPFPPPVRATPLPAPSGGAAPTEQHPAVPPTAASSGIPQPHVDDPNFLSQLPDWMRPDLMNKRADDLAANGDKEGADRLRGEAQRLSEKYANDGKAVLPGGKIVNVPGWTEAAAAQARVPENQKWIDDQATQAVARSQARETLGVIQKVLENYEPGSLAGIKANAQALGKALGINVPDSATANAEAYDLFVKSTLQNVFQTVKDIGGKPLVSEIEGLKRAVPNPELQPGANRQMLAQLYSRLDQADKLYQDIAPDLDTNAGLNRGKWTADWLKKKENDINQMAADKQRDIAVRGYLPPLSKMEVGSTYIIEPGQEEAYGLPKGYLKDYGPTKMRFLGKEGWKPIR